MTDTVYCNTSINCHSFNRQPLKLTRTVSPLKNQIAVENHPCFSAVQWRWQSGMKLSLTIVVLVSNILDPPRYMEKVFTAKQLLERQRNCVVQESILAMVGCVYILSTLYYSPLFYSICYTEKWLCMCMMVCIQHVVAKSDSHATCFLHFSRSGF